MSFLQPIEELTLQLIGLLKQLNVRQYIQPIPSLHQATIGQHVRHIVEMFQELEKGYRTGVVNYDMRNRDPLLQTEPQSAIETINALLAYVEQPDKVLEVAGNYCYGSSMPLTVQSTYHRELIYNIEHAIHHMAYIKIAVQQFQNITLPAEFGVAFATNHFRKACAQ